MGVRCVGPVSTAVVTVGLVAAVAACAPGQSAPGSTSGSAGSGGGSAARTIDWNSFKGKKLTYLYFTDGPDEAATRSAIKDFEAKSGGTVDLQITPYADLATSLQARLSGGNAPDVARVNEVTPYVNDLVDLHEILGKDYDKDFVAGQVKAVTRDGKLLAVPSDLTMNGPLINVDQFKKAGVEIPTKWTWDEMIAAAKKVKAANNTEAGIAMDNSGHRLSTVLSQFGTAYLGDGVTNALDEAKATKAVDQILSLTKDGTMNKDFFIAAGTKYKGANDMFLAGQVPISISGNWQVAQFAKSAKFTWAAAPNPCADKCGGFPGGKFMAAFTKSPNKEMAAAFIQFMNTKETQAKIDQTAMWLPTRNDLVKEGVTYPQRSDDMKVFTADIANTPDYAFVSNSSPAFGGYANAFLKEFAKAVAGQVDAATMVKNGKAAGDKVIAGTKK